MTDRRVVISGLGAVTPLGSHIETFWSNLMNGVSGIHTIDTFDTAVYDCKIRRMSAARIDLLSLQWQLRKSRSRIAALMWRTSDGEIGLVFLLAPALVD